MTPQKQNPSHKEQLEKHHSKSPGDSSLRFEGILESVNCQQAYYSAMKCSKIEIAPYTHIYEAFKVYGKRAAKHQHFKEGVYTRVRACKFQR